MSDQNDQFQYVLPQPYIPNPIPQLNHNPYFVQQWYPSPSGLSAFTIPAAQQTANFDFRMTALNQTANDSGFSSMHQTFETPKNVPILQNSNTKEENEEDASSVSKMSDYDANNHFQIPGRLGLLNSNRTYIIKMDEIKRRLGSPEKLNTSYINGIVRKAKGREAGALLREKLEKNNINVEHGRRINVKTTCFLPLCEDESLRIAEDFESLLNKFIPRQKLKQSLRSSVKANIKNLRSSIGELRNSFQQGKDTTQTLTQLFQVMPKELGRIFENDQTLKIQKEQQSGPYAKLNSDIQFPSQLQEEIWRLNLATHNFAGLGLKAIFEQTTIPEVQTNTRIG